MDAPTFRSNFPEFSDTTAYPDGQVNFYLALAVNLLNTNVWKSLLDQGTQLYIAHALFLARRRQKTAAVGGVPGAAQGMVSGKTVDKVSVTYDTTPVALDAGGQWNLSDYGIQFLQLARIVGAQGATQL